MNASTHVVVDKTVNPIVIYYINQYQFKGYNNLDSFFYRLNTKSSGMELEGFNIRNVYLVQYLNN